MIAGADWKAEIFISYETGKIKKNLHFVKRWNFF